MNEKNRVEGPNQFWYKNDNNSLKPLGFNIHECIDGYSRKVLWLEVSSSNRNPRIVAKFYMDAVPELKGVPKFCWRRQWC